MMDGSLASTTQQEAGGFAWPQAIPWAIAVISLCFNAYQWVRNRRPLVRTKVATVRNDEPGSQHVRWLTVEVANFAADLHDLLVQLEWTKDGKKQTHAMSVVGDVPNPFKLGHSRRFTILNEDPRQSVGLEDVPADQIAIVVYSGIREVRRLQGTAVKREIDAFSKVDPSMPTKPSPPSRQADSDWLRSRRSSW